MAGVVEPRGELLANGRPPALPLIKIGNSLGRLVRWTVSTAGLTCLPVIFDLAVLA